MTASFGRQDEIVASGIDPGRCHRDPHRELQLGELMAAQKATVGVNGGSVGKGRPNLDGIQNTPSKHDAPSTLAEAGIDQNLAHRARAYATSRAPRKLSR